MVSFSKEKWKLTVGTEKITKVSGRKLFAERDPFSLASNFTKADSYPSLLMEAKVPCHPDCQEAQNLLVLCG